MEEQLGALYNLTRGREGYSRDLESLGVEGVDHINVSRTLITDLVSCLLLLLS